MAGFSWGSRLYMETYFPLIKRNRRWQYWWPMEFTPKWYTQPKLLLSDPLLPDLLNSDDDEPAVASIARTRRTLNHFLLLNAKYSNVNYDEYHQLFGCIFLVGPTFGEDSEVRPGWGWADRQRGSLIVISQYTMHATTLDPTYVIHLEIATCTSFFFFYFVCMYLFWVL